jgi:ferredoxin-NADP reductase
MTLPGLDDPRGPTRPFTISSNPTEGDVVAISTLIRGSPFKRHLASMVPGDSVENEAIEGDFVLAPGRPAVMLAGGMGVTPFRSMLRFAVDTRLEKPSVLVYSSKTPEDIVFRSELEDFTRRHHALRVLRTITRPELSHEPWAGRKGRIDAGLIREGMRSLRHPVVYAAGPPGFVTEARRLSDEELKISKEDIRTDEFEGYCCGGPRIGASSSDRWCGLARDRIRSPLPREGVSTPEAGGKREGERRMPKDAVSRHVREETEERPRRLQGATDPHPRDSPREDDGGD